MKNILKLLFGIIFGIISFQNVFADCTTPSASDPHKCPDGSAYTADNTPQGVEAAKGKNPISCSGSGLAGAGCTVNINKLVGVKGADEGVSSRKDLLSFTQDAVKGLTLFIGTVVLIALIYSGWLYLMAGGDEKMAEKGKNGIKNSIIGLVLVLLSYIIIRALQYFAVGN